MNNLCLLHVLSKEQIDILLKDHDNLSKVNWRHRYLKVSKYYQKISSILQEKTPIDKETGDYILECFELCILSLKNMVPMIPEVLEMTKWVSHRVSEMGHLKLGISNKECMKLGASTFDELLSKVRNCIEPSLVDSMNDEDFLENLSFAQRCYQIDYQARETTTICGESMDEKHIFRRDLAKALSMVISDWIIAQEDSSNKRQRIS